MEVRVAGLRRNIKNVAYNYTEPQKKVREATSNDPWGPSSTLMSEIADLTYNVEAFPQIMEMLWKRINDHGKNWRHVYKSLLLLEYLIKTGSERVAQQCKENIFAIQTLKDFQYYEEGKDQGMNVREKSKQLVTLLSSEERLREERSRAVTARERFAKTITGFGDMRQGSQMMGHRSGTAEMEQSRPQSLTEEELQLQIALAMSKEEAEHEEKLRRSDDLKLQMALSQSQQEFQETAHTSPASSGNMGAVGGAVGGASALVDLLDVDIAPPPHMQASHEVFGAVGGSDPWGTSSSSVSMMPNPVMSDPWKMPGGVPTAIATIQPPPKDPWNLTSPTGSGGSDAMPMPTLSSDPWATTVDSPIVNTSPSKPDPWFSSPNNNNNNEDLSTAFNLDPLLPSPSSNGSTPNSDANKMTGNKTSPSNFLGANSNLINLDSLLSTGYSNKPTMATTNNPFSTQPTMYPSSLLSNSSMQRQNPFHAPVTTKPTLNELSSHQQQTNIGGWNNNLNNNIIGNNGFGAAPSSSDPWGASGVQGGIKPNPFLG